MILTILQFTGAIILLFIICYLRQLHKLFRKAKVCEGVGVENGTKFFSQVPGPIPMPIVGNLTLLRKYTSPFEAFTHLSNIYGNIYSLTLGNYRCVVVSNLKLIREVLNNKGSYFGGRPDFLRYHVLFGGDRNNSLALCDWSCLQQQRRNLARKYCSPRYSSIFFHKMSDVACLETAEMMETLEKKLASSQLIDFKPLLQQTCANMFMHYMCSTRFDYNDSEFRAAVECFDEIFWEINQGYAVDFLPWLSPVYKSHFDLIVNWSKGIRKFILKRIIACKEQNFGTDTLQNDFTDSLLNSLFHEKNMSRSTIVFMLEDFIGGHSAVGNLVMLVLFYVSKYPHVGEKIRTEADFVSNLSKRKLIFSDKELMPYTTATILEVLRFSSSPIVPHVATEDVVISGFGILAGTIVFINNYYLNQSNEYWHDAEKFSPERFLEEIPVYEKDKSLLTNQHCTQKDRFQWENSIKNDKQMRVKKGLSHFMPFSIGKRTCVGQKLVHGFGFIILANILQKYNVFLEDNISFQRNPACVALPTKTHSLRFIERTF